MVPRRKVGRPKKMKPAEKPRRGRRPKKDVNEVVEAAKVVPPPPPAGIKRRGRKRRPITVAHSNEEVRGVGVTDNNNDGEAVATEKKKSRKRRPKAATNSNEEIHVDVGEKKKRGRKRKNQNPNHPPGGPPVKRGRKSKKDTSQIAELLANKRSAAAARKSQIPPTKPTATGDDLPEDELQEERYKEEMLKVKSNINEGLIYCDTRGEESGHDHEESDGELALDDTDDEENDGPCPRPGPRKGRGGRKCIKAKNQKIELSAEEFQEMASIIKGSKRKSLAGNSAAAAANEDERGLHYPDYRVYNTVRYFVEQQEQWNQRLQESAASGEGGRVTSLCLHQMRRHGLGKQLYIEHFSWLSVVIMDEKITSENVQISQSGVLAWIPDFQLLCGWRYSNITDDSVPDCNSDIDLALKLATTKSSSNANRLWDMTNKVRSSNESLTELVKKASYDKRTICKKFEQANEEFGMQNTVEETNIWGLKPIRLALEPPYFKTEDGMCAVPEVPDAVIRSKTFATCFFKRDKQKWTTKDLDQLKTCIREVLLTKRLTIIENKYIALLSDCECRYVKEIAEEGRFNSPSVEPLRKGDRPRRTDLDVTTKYGIIHPVICVMKHAELNIDITVRNEVSSLLLTQWRFNEEKQLNLKTYEQLVTEDETIDWGCVSSKIISRSRKNRSAEDCELAWIHEVHPKVNNKRWSKDESERLVNIFENCGNDWYAVAADLNRTASAPEKPERTPYQCFFRIRNKIAPPKKLEWTNDLDIQLLTELKEHPGNWRVAAASLSDPAATKRLCIERYKKTINPVLRSGPFTRVEDCLLILTIEKLKPFLAREGHFGCLLSYLPWRCETTWRDRANNLFSDWIVPWTLDEDKMLLELAETMNRNWQQISEEFTSFKNRKGCLTRYKILKARLADKRFNNSLEAYHEAYAMTRYNVFQYKHLKEVLTLLQRVKDSRLPPEHQNFVGLLRDGKPSEVRLQHMLLTFDREILNTTIMALSRYTETRDNYWRTWIEKHGKRKRTFDRRTFHPDNAQSVASALHIQGLKLKDKKDIPDLNDFENEVLKFYARFCRTKALKTGVKRPYIPDAKTLAGWSVVSRLIATPVEQLEHEDQPIKRKWRALKNNEMTFTKLKYARGTRKVPQAPKRPYKKRGPKPKTSQEILVSKIQKRKYTMKKRVPMKVKSSKLAARSVQTNQEGYLLIPKESITKKVSGSRASRKKNEEDVDPEYFSAAKKRESGNERKVEKCETSSGPRRSSRASKGQYVPQHDPEDYDDDDPEDT